MTVQSALTAAIPPGAILETLTRREPFVVAGYRDESMVLLLGPQRSRTPIPWQVWEELGPWLTARGWTELGAGRGQPIPAGRKDSPARSQASGTRTGTNHFPRGRLPHDSR